MVDFLFLADGVLDLGISDLLSSFAHLMGIQPKVFHQLVDARSALCLRVKREVVAAGAFALIIAQILLRGQLDAIRVYGILLILFFDL